MIEVAAHNNVYSIVYIDYMGRYAPMLGVMMLTCQLTSPASPQWVDIVMIASVLFRIIHAVRNHDICMRAMAAWS